MEYKIRSYPQFSACGLNCGLCPRYHTTGTSQCPGCGGKNFLVKHPTCGVLSCCQRKEIEYCYQCNEYPCKKYEGAEQSDSFITHLNQLKDMEQAKDIGLDIYSGELNEKISILKMLLEKYDDGRRKSFYCIAINILGLRDIQDVMEKVELSVCLEQPIKEKALLAVGLFQATAENQGIPLKLRKKVKK